MELGQAFQDALHIFEEERVRPTLRYRYVGKEWPRIMKWEIQTLQQQGCSPEMAGVTALSRMRDRRPREVEEDPKGFQFQSVNFDLLLAIMSQLSGDKRPEFVAALVKGLLWAAPLNRHEFQIPFPSWNNQTTSLSLLAEFCVRNGYAQILFDGSQHLQMPSVGVAIMLKGIEEIIALNYNLFSRQEIDNLPKALAHLREIADLQTWSSRRQHGKPEIKNPKYRQGYSSQGNEVVAAIDAITQLCNQARYFYLKGVYQQSTNLEIENDKIKVQDFLAKLGFKEEMIGALDAAEKDYKSTSTPFELKSSLVHLRSFIEHLHRDAAKTISVSAGATVEDRWGPALVYLRQQGFLTLQHEEFVAKLYTLISDESVHALGADREYARLLRNMVIEYGLMFLTALDKQGVKI